MKLFLYNIGIILIGIICLFLLTCLLDIRFIQAHVIRQILVYLILVIVTFIVFRILTEINKQDEN